MRPLTRLGLAVLIALLVLVAAYSAFWRIAAGRIADGLLAWRQAESARHIDASWRAMRVTGFPSAFRVVLDNTVLRERAWHPAPELRFRSFAASARPWNLRNWTLSAPDGMSAELAAAGARPALWLKAQSVTGLAFFARPGGGWLWFNLRGVAAEVAGPIPIQSAEAWVILPARPPKADTDTNFGLALDLKQVGVARPPVGFAAAIDRLAFALTLRGPVPDGPLVPAVAAWRDAGGTIDVDNFRLDWSGVGVIANGTLALDQNLQPTAAFSGGIEGFGVVLNAMVAADQLTPEQAALAQIALTSLAKPGPDGRPQIMAPFTIQSGKMFLGPARLGRAPRIVWQ